MNEELNGVPSLVCEDSEPNSPASLDQNRSVSRKLDQTLNSSRELIRELNAWLEIQEPRKRMLRRFR
jgi:hypothetical protein